VRHRDYKVGKVCWGRVELLRQSRTLADIILAEPGHLEKMSI